MVNVLKSKNGNTVYPELRHCLIASARIFNVFSVVFVKPGRHRICGRSLFSLILSLADSFSSFSLFFVGFEHISLIFGGILLGSSLLLLFSTVCCFSPLCVLPIVSWPGQWCGNGGFWPHAPQLPWKTIFKCIKFRWKKYVYRVEEMHLMDERNTFTKWK